MQLIDDKELYQIIGNNIKFFRKKAGLTQIQLSEQVQISLSYLSKIESSACEKSISISVLNHIANTLNIELIEFFKRRWFYGKKPNIHGGGAKTNINGLTFEQTTSLDESFTLAGYKVENHEVYYNDEIIGLSVPKHCFYKHFLVPNEVIQKDYTSKKWLPDECFVNYKSNCVYIIEKNFKIAVVRSMKKRINISLDE